MDKALYARMRCYYARMNNRVDFLSVLVIEEKLEKDVPLSPLEIRLLNKIMAEELIEEEEACLSTLRKSGRLPY